MMGMKHLVKVFHKLFISLRYAEKSRKCIVCALRIMYLEEIRFTLKKFIIAFTICKMMIS